MSNIDWKHILTLAKKNIASILSGVIAIASIGFVLFYVAPGFEELQSEVEQRAAVRQELDSMRTKSRPDIKLREVGLGEEEEMLTGFPTRPTITMGEQVMDRVRLNAGRLLTTEVELNRRLPLLFDDYDEAAEAWPLSGQNNIFDRDQWLNRYRQVMSVDAESFDEDSGSFPASSLLGRIAATLPPTQESVSIAQEKRRLAIEASAATNQDTGEFLDPEGVAEQINRELSSLARNLRYNRAADHLIYVTPGVPEAHPVAGNRGRPESEEIFQGQMHYWALETILLRLTDINARAVADLDPADQNVVSAPVKQIVALSVPTEFPSGSVSVARQPSGGAQGGFGGSPAGPGNAPPPPPSSAPPPPPGQAPSQQQPAEVETPEVTVAVDASASLPLDYSLSPSGRSSHNAFFDAIQFEITLRVAADALPDVLQQFQVDSFITVLNVQRVEPLDPVVALQQGYVFGDVPVLEVDLEAEILFLREWTAPLMPDSVKEALNELSGAGSSAIPAF
ncbi:MAG: hypothetical protein AAF561_06150 [Planctomycetota bacterium]